MFLLFPENLDIQNAMIDIVDEIHSITNEHNKVIPSQLIFGEFQDLHWLQDPSLSAQSHILQHKNRQQYMTFASVTASLATHTNTLTRDIITRTQGLEALSLPGQRNQNNLQWYQTLYSDYPASQTTAPNTAQDGSMILSYQDLREPARAPRSVDSGKRQYTQNQTKQQPSTRGAGQQSSSQNSYNRSQPRSDSSQPQRNIRGNVGAQKR